MEVIDFKTRGKVPATTVNKLLNNMLLVAASKQVKEDFQHYLSTNNLDCTDIGHPTLYARIYHACRSIAEYDMKYDNTHPAYSPWENIHGELQPARERLIPFCGWSTTNDYYGNGCHDSHWTTVQNQVKDLFVQELTKILSE